MQVVVRPIDDEYLATLFDANLGMTGDTAEEAIANLKATIVDTFELFEENEAALGRSPSGNWRFSGNWSKNKNNMARVITKELAEKIAQKLRAKRVTKKGRAHDDYVVHFQGQLIARFGIRHGSKKDQGHDHIPGAIHLAPHDAKLFGQCDHPYEYWVSQMRQKGIIPPEAD